MRLIDSGVLTYVHRLDTSRHKEAQALVSSLLEGDRSVAVTGLVFSEFVGIVTDPSVFVRPSPVDDALEFCRRLSSHPAATWIAPGPRHWGIVERLLRQPGVDTGGSARNAYVAALCLETGAELVTTDLAFRRFGELRLQILGGASTDHQPRHGAA